MRDLKKSFATTPERSEPTDNSFYTASVMPVVWSRQQVVQRTFGTTGEQ